MRRNSRWTAVLRRGIAALASLATLATVFLAPSSGAAEIGTVIAHRGDRASAPENTSAAFRSAIFNGVDAIEMDIRFTRTGVPVVLHDETLDRTTNCSGRVSALSLGELNRCDAGGWFDPGFKGERVPTLKGALGEIAVWSKSVTAVVHLKHFTAAWQPDRVMEAVVQRHMEDRTVFIADEVGILEQMEESGAERLGLIFAWPSGWQHRYPYMIPQDNALDPLHVAEAHERGAVVWAIEGRPAGLSGMRSLAPIDGILVDNLNALYRSRARQSDSRPELAAPGWSASSDDALSTDLTLEQPVALPAAVQPPGDPAAAGVLSTGALGALPFDVPLPSSTVLSFNRAQAAREDVIPVDADMLPVPAEGLPALEFESADSVYGPVPVPAGGWRPTGRLRAPGAGLGN